MSWWGSLEESNCCLGLGLGLGEQQASLVSNKLDINITDININLRKSPIVNCIWKME